MVQYQHFKTPEFQPQQSGVYIILFYYKTFNVKNKLYVCFNFFIYIFTFIYVIYL